MINCAAILGGSLEALEAARDLADRGVNVCLVTSGPHIGEYEGPHNDYSFEPMAQLILSVWRHPRVRLFTSANLCAMEEREDGFTLTIRKEAGWIEETRCSTCGSCVAACPVTRGEDKPIAFTRLQGIPPAIAIDKRGTPPCRAACPAGVNAQGYIALIRKGRFREALDLERRENPFAATCGRVCTHPCEDHCTRKDAGGPLSIRHLKRFLADAFLENEKSLGAATPKAPSGMKAAVIGAGPAGLTCAHYLALEGHDVTVFERRDEPGGMARYGIPAFRLPKEILAREIEYLCSPGVKIETGKALGSEITIDSLFDKGYRAVFLATGAWKGRKLDFIDGGGMGVYDAIEFMAAVNSGENVPVGNKVAVIGGGNSALDAARTARRLGAKNVILVYRRTRLEMPAASAEVEDTLREGITLEELATPLRVVRKGGAIRSLVCLRNMLGEPDASGRRAPVPIEGSDFTLTADTIIGAIGQSAEDDLLEREGVALSRGLAVIDKSTMETSRPGVFAGGDMVLGPATLIEAVAAGKKAALHMSRRMRGEPLDAPWSPGLPPVPEEELHTLRRHAESLERLSFPVRDRKKAVKDFKEVDGGYTEDQAKAEAARCLDCGFCSECLECERACEDAGALSHLRSPAEETFRARVVIVADAQGRESLERVLAVTSEADILSRPIPGERILDISRSKTHAPFESFSGEGPYPEKERRRILALAGAAVASSLIGEARAPGAAAGSAGRAFRRPPENVGVVLCTCASNMEGRLEPLAEYALSQHRVVHSEIVSALCSDRAVQKLVRTVLEKNLDRLVLASCACCSIDQICEGCSYSRVRMKKQILPALPLSREAVEMINIKEQWGFVHPDNTPGAISKGCDLLSLALTRVMNVERPETVLLDLPKRVLIAGADIVGLEAALLLESLGYDVRVLDDRDAPAVGVSSNAEREDSVCSRIERLRRSRVAVSTGARILGVTGLPGRYIVSWQEESGRADFVNLLSSEAGAVLWDSSTGVAAGTFAPTACKAPDPCFLWGFFKARTRRDLGTPWNVSQAQYLAGAVDAFLSKGVLSSLSGRFSIDPAHCRDCRKCIETCPHGVPSPGDPAQPQRSHIPETLCRACGICAPACPTSSISSADARYYGALIRKEAGSLTRR
jgi:NADPH-dependent glutamate synthase beta subunit-like oxidoreductase